MKELIIASNNSGKLAEFQAILTTFKCISQNKLGIPNVEETGLSFIENAILKARHASLHANKPALADDSGLVVDALHGEPGIYSARYAGTEATDQDNINLLLKKLTNISMENRQAYFYCALAFVRYPEDPIPILATGQFVGRIASKPEGTNGFGYDPIFFVPEYNCTVAELPKSIKNTISHRALALTQLQQALRDAHA